jgi:hypothetical protein
MTMKRMLKWGSRHDRMGCNRMGRNRVGGGGMTLGHVPSARRALGVLGEGDAWSGR